MLYPLKFKPILKEKIWGGDKLHFKSTGIPENLKTGESWEISGVKTDVSIVENGHLKDKALTDLILEYKDQLLGNSVYSHFKTEFPILIKFIEAKENLSVQVHPDDKLARKRHNSFGKTEMWYIVEAENNSRLIIDFKESMSAKGFGKLLKEGTLEFALNSIQVNKGDAFFIKPGLVHAIGAGVLLAEIQQTSDITYRLFDWNRKDREGKSRELHTDLALDAIDFTKKNEYKIDYEPRLNSKVQLADTPYFKTNIIEIKGTLELDYSQVDSFIIFMNVGLEETIIVHENIEYFLSSRETLLIPACVKFIQVKSNSTKLLEISI